MIDKDETMSNMKPKTDEELISQIKEVKFFAKSIITKSKKRKLVKVGMTLVFIFVFNLMISGFVYLISPEKFEDNYWIVLVFSIAIGIYFNVTSEKRMD